jgi:hypothetical protein
MAPPNLSATKMSGSVGAVRSALWSVVKIHRARQRGNQHQHAPQYSHRSAVLPAPCCWVGVLQTHKQLQGEAGGSMDLTALKTNKAMSALM